LHYCVVLKEDTFENRNKIFGILNFYEQQDFSAFFPVDFQFVPIELSSKIEFEEKYSF
jgi:hypothetical protein